jgi:hypothetical protein
MDPPRGVGVELAFGRPEVRAVGEARTPESPIRVEPEHPSRHRDPVVILEPRPLEIREPAGLDLDFWRHKLGSSPLDPLRHTGHVDPSRHHRVPRSLDSRLFKRRAKIERPESPRFPPDSGCFGVRRGVYTLRSEVETPKSSRVYDQLGATLGCS